MPSPSSEPPNRASVAGSGTSADATPATAAVNEAIVCPAPPALQVVQAASETGGVTLLNENAMARGRPSVVITSETKLAVGANTAIAVAPLAVIAASENRPLR